MTPEREREALMRLTMCAREECSMCKYQGDCNYDFQYELATKNMNILADALRADRKTNSSEIPNNCETCRFDDRYGDESICKECARHYSDNYAPIEDEPTISKMEQVDEPQIETKTETKNSNLTFEKRTMRDCYNCKRYETEGECIECHFEPKDEPQTERSE